MRSWVGRIVFFGGYDPEYPRNAILRKGLSRKGIEVIECRAEGRLKAPLRYPALLFRFLQKRAGGGSIFVPDFRHKDVPIAWLIARLTGVGLVFDPLVSRFETRVLDRKDAPRGSLQAWHNRNIDRLTLRLADLVLADTGEHARYYSREFSVPFEKIRILPVGFDEDIYVPRATRKLSKPARVLFYGSYLPLHGVETIVEAARQLSSEQICFVMVGNGQTRADAEKLACGIPKAKFVFVDRVPQRELVDRISESDIVLGIFGSTPKATMVVPNKIYQSLAVGRAVITADTPAVREFFTSGVHLLTVPMADSRALADAIVRLIEDSTKREELALSGAEYVRKKFSSSAIADICISFLKEADFL